MTDPLLLRSYRSRTTLWCGENDVVVISAVLGVESCDSTRALQYFLDKLLFGVFSNPFRLRYRLILAAEGEGTTIKDVEFINGSPDRISVLLLDFSCPFPQTFILGYVFLVVLRFLFFELSE